jgi:hypothetical protein
LLAAFRRFAVGHYRKNGKPTRSLGNLADAVRPLKLLYGREPVAEFGPRKLKAIRHLMVKGFTDPHGRVFPPLARKTVNKRIGIVKQVFKWGTSEETHSVSHQSNSTLRGKSRRADQTAWCDSKRHEYP